jgi:hypothetical protein
MPLWGLFIAMRRFGHKDIFDAAPTSRRMLSRASSLSSLKPLSYSNGRAPFNFNSKARVFFGIIGIFAWTYACSSSAFAEIEEDTNQELNKPGYSISTLSNYIMTNLLIDNHTDEDVARYLSTLDNPHNDTDRVGREAEIYTGSHPAFPSSANSHGFDDAFIPETVWSLNVSTGAHLDHISGGPGSEIYTVFGGRPKINDFWIRAIFGSWKDNNADRASGLLIASPKVQVASCGGSSAEHSDLDYCDSTKLVADQVSDTSLKPGQSNSSASTQSANNNVLSSNGAPASELSAQPNTIPFTPAFADTSPVQETLSVLGPCSVSAFCASVQVDPRETPVDALVLDPPPLIGDLTPPIDLPNPEALPPGPTNYGGDPGSDPSLPPVFIPQPLKPIPEVSTWVMTIIGFSMMAFLFGKKRRLRLNPISDCRRLRA